MPLLYPAKPEAQIASKQSATSDPVHDVQEPVSTESTVEKSLQHMPLLYPANPEEQVASKQSATSNPEHDVHEPVSTESTLEKS